MKRILGALGAVLVSLFLIVPVVAAADPLPHTGRVVIATEGDVTIPAGDHADVVVVINGTATVAGEVNTILAVDGAVVLSAARTESVVAIRSPSSSGRGRWSWVTS
jgi:hypothetical protein